MFTRILFLLIMLIWVWVNILVLVLIFTLFLVSYWFIEPIVWIITGKCIHIEKYFFETIHRCSKFDKQIMKYFHIKFGNLDNNLVC